MPPRSTTISESHVCQKVFSLSARFGEIEIDRETEVCIYIYIERERGERERERRVSAKQLGGNLPECFLAVNQEAAFLINASATTLHSTTPEQAYRTEKVSALILMESRRRAEYSFGEHGLKHRTQ